MTWDYVAFNALIRTVYEKYNSSFWGRPKEWESYLKSNGIIRDDRRKPLEQDDEVQIECPWSIHSVHPCPSPQRKIYLSIPKHVANKIVILEMMP